MDHPWTGSFSPLENSQWADLPAQTATDLPVVGLLILIAGLCLAMYNNFIQAAADSFSTLVSPTRQHNTQRNRYNQQNQMLFFVLFIPYFAMILKIGEISTKSFWITIVALSVYFLFRYLAVNTLAWISGKRATAVEATSVSVAILFAMFLVMLPFAAIPRVFPDAPQLLTRISIIVLFIVLYLWLLVKERSIFLNSGFSHFFWILYLCALEILPLCVAVTAIAS